MIKELLAIAPQMVFIQDGKGNFPLHIAIHNQLSCDITCDLFEAFPEVGNMKDAKTGLLPFMQAAVDNWERERDQITIAYRLLRENPHSIKWAKDCVQNTV